MPFLLFFFCVFLVVYQTQAQTSLINFFSIYPQIDENIWYVSHGWSNGDHQSCEWRREAVSAKNKKLIITLSTQGSAKRSLGCGELQSKKKFHYGRYEARLRAAKGSGLNTAFFTYTGPPHGSAQHDEIDFEFLGKNTKEVEVTFWQNGNQFKVQKIPLGFDAAEDFATYAFEWREDSIKWFVNDRLVFETPDGAAIPSQPGKIFISLWSGGKDTEQWLGDFRYTRPVSAEYEWIKYTPYSYPNR